MTRRPGITKADSEAHRTIGAAYAAIPKSAWALVAYHLANLCAEEPDSFDSIMARILEEAVALEANDILPTHQLKVVRKAIAKAART